MAIYDFGKEKLTLQFDDTDFQEGFLGVEGDVNSRGFVVKIKNEEGLILSEEKDIKMLIREENAKVVLSSVGTFLPDSSEYKFIAPSQIFTKEQTVEIQFIVSDASTEETLLTKIFTRKIYNSLLADPEVNSDDIFIDYNRVHEFSLHYDEKMEQLITLTNNSVKEINLNKDEAITAITDLKNASVQEINTVGNTNLKNITNTSNKAISDMTLLKNTTVDKANEVAENKALFDEKFLIAKDAIDREEERIANENIRISNENKRIEAEKQRVIDNSVVKGWIADPSQFKGDPGTSITIKGVIPNSSSLPSGPHEMNDSYQCADTKDVYVWTGSKFENLGPMQGAKGERGEQGFQGIPGIQGLKGETGPQGPRGEQGLRGETGPRGERGLTGEQGPQGEKGDVGASLKIIGVLDNTGLLPETGKLGDGYVIKGDLHVWTEQNKWVNIGRFEGPKGDKGEPGIQGKAGATGERGPAGATGPAGKDAEFNDSVTSSSTTWSSHKIHEEIINNKPNVEGLDQLKVDVQDLKTEVGTSRTNLVNNLNSVIDTL